MYRNLLKANYSYFTSILHKIFQISNDLKDFTNDLNYVSSFFGSDNTKHYYITIQFEIEKYALCGICSYQFSPILESFPLY